MDTNYNKYLKYKKKYLDLIIKLNLDKKEDKKVDNHIGGGYFYKRNEEIKEQDRINGTITPKYSFKSCTLKVNFNPNTPLYLYLKENANKINNSNESNLDHDFHLSLLQMDINLSHILNSPNGQVHNPDNNFAYRVDSNNKFISEKFTDKLATINLIQAFLNLFRGVEFESTNFGFLGEQELTIGSEKKNYKSFIVQLFQIPNREFQQRITEFRKIFYDLVLEYIQSINPRIEKFEVKEKTVGGKKYFLLYYKPKNLMTESLDTQTKYNEPLFAIPEYYWGPGVWTPHISLAKIVYDPTNPNEIYRRALQITSDSDHTHIDSTQKQINRQIYYNKISFKFYQRLISSIQFE